MVFIVPIITKVVSSNPTHGKVYLIQMYVIKFVSYLQQVGGFHQVIQSLPPIKLAEGGVKHHNPNPIWKQWCLDSTQNAPLNKRKISEV